MPAARTCGKLERHSIWTGNVCINVGHCRAQSGGKSHSAAAGIILCMGSANERRRYNVTSSIIGWALTQNDPCAGDSAPKCLALITLLMYGSLNNILFSSVNTDFFSTVNISCLYMYGCSREMYSIERNVDIWRKFCHRPFLYAYLTMSQCCDGVEYVINSCLKHRRRRSVAHWCVVDRCQKPMMSNSSPKYIDV